MELVDGHAILRWEDLVLVLRDVLLLGLLRRILEAVLRLLGEGRVFGHLLIELEVF